MWAYSRSFEFYASHVIDPAYKSPSPEVLSYGENYFIAPFFKIEIDSVVLNIHDSKEPRIAEPKCALACNTGSEFKKTVASSL